MKITKYERKKITVCSYQETEHSRIRGSGPEKQSTEKAQNEGQRGKKKKVSKKNKKQTENPEKSIGGRYIERVYPNICNSLKITVITLLLKINLWNYFFFPLENIPLGI